MANILTIFRGRQRQLIVVQEQEGVRALRKPTFHEAAATGLKPDHTVPCAIEEGDMTEVMAHSLMEEGQDIALCGVHELNFGYPHRRAVGRTGEAPASTKSPSRR